MHMPKLGTKQEVKSQKFALKRPLQKNLRQILNLFYRYENKARNLEFSVVWTGAWVDIAKMRRCQLMRRCTDFVEIIFFRQSCRRTPFSKFLDKKNFHLKFFDRAQRGEKF